MLQIMPGYTLETLSASDIDNLLPFFYAVTSPEEDSVTSSEAPESNIVFRDGKPYKKVTAKDADWASGIF